MTEDDPILQNQPPEFLNELQVKLLEASHQLLNSQVQTDELVSRVLAAHKSNDPIFNALLEGSLTRHLLKFKKMMRRKIHFLNPDL